MKPFSVTSPPSLRGILPISPARIQRSTLARSTPSISAMSETAMRRAIRLFLDGGGLWKLEGSDGKTREDSAGAGLADDSSSVKRGDLLLADFNPARLFSPPGKVLRARAGPGSFLLFYLL